MAHGYTHEPAYDAGHLEVSSLHEIYYEQYGKIDGLPVIFLHGGPGGNTSPANAKYFNPDVYRVVLMDQRGVGKSHPQNELEENTTQHLSDDINKLREHLGIEKWHMVFGGSWGSTLALYYAQAHPELVSSMVLRGVFTAQAGELSYKFGPVAAEFYPEAWERFVSFIPEEERNSIRMAYYKRITSSDPEISQKACREWNRWDLSIGTLHQDPNAFDKLDDAQWCRTHALFEAHYITVNKGWMEDGYLLRPENMAKIKDIPGRIVQGRYDMVCPPTTAYKVHKAWTSSKLQIIHDAGHSASEPGTYAALVQACDELAEIRNWVEIPGV
ncbi:proline iminopeptidase [Xylariaceae sp. FL1019]|nr:proline iminopeptidase [Xylariaceae sp. FL1019]